MTKIVDMKTGEEFTGYYLVKELEVKHTNSTPPKPYLDLMLSDNSGQISTKYWDLRDDEKDRFKAMSIVKLQGLVQTYRDRLQVKVIRIRPADAADQVSLSDYIRTAPVGSDELLATIDNAIATLNRTDIQRLVQFCVDKVRDKLSHYPAAKTHHHAFYGGLAYHMVRMLELGEFICKQRPFLDADLLRAGIILHDIAKPEEMWAEWGIVTDYSVRGKLIGHLALASQWLAEAAVRLDISSDSPELLHLQHLVLSHHNLGEWGSPVQPQTPEAIALHYIDTLDARLQMAEDALNAASSDSLWTQPIRGLENKALYRGGLDPYPTSDSQNS